MLRSGEQRIVEVQADDFTTKIAKAARDAAYAAGKVPIVSRKLDALRLAALKLTAYMQGELGIILAGKSEATVVYEQESPGGPVLCRSRLDHFIRERAVIYDLKKIESAHPSKCEAQIASYGYDIQGAAYTRAVEEVFPELVGRVSFVLLFCEIEPPYVVTPIELDGQFRQLGETKWDRAVTTWGACLRANTWPAYAERGRVLRASPPRWALARELAEAI
jgi:hypothetical protein